jgi:hypothetical protein
LRHAAETARRTSARTALAVIAGAALAVALIAVVGYAPPSVNAAQAQYAPTNTAKPTISDTSPQVGQQLTATPGTWSGDQPMAFTYEWQRCNAQGASCVAIPNATQQTYTVQSTDLGTRLRVEVTATNATGAGEAVSDPTDAVTAATPTPPPTGTAPIATITAPNRLLIDSVQFSPNPIRASNRSITVRVRVLEVQNRRPVEGALVFLRSTPVVTTTPPERATDATGWATFQIAPERDFRRLTQPGYSLQFFVRARKSGEDLLAGVSSRRLVQVAIAR